MDKVANRRLLLGVTGGIAGAAGAAGAAGVSPRLVSTVDGSATIAVTPLDAECRSCTRTP